MEPNHRDNEWTSVTRLLPGLILVGIGALFLLDNLRIVAARQFIGYWPVILVVVGLVKLVDSTGNDGRLAGGVLTGIGAVLLANNLGFIYLTWGVLWSLLIIGAGLYLLFQRLPWPSRDGAAAGPGFLTEVAIFGGGSRKIMSQDFQGGTITAIFGGVDLDLRNAGMRSDSATLDINSVFGGAQIRIPLTWTVELRGTGIFGGYGDETVAPDPRTTETKRLIIKGASIFGGVGVKN